MTVLLSIWRGPILPDTAGNIVYTTCGQHNVTQGDIFSRSSQHDIARARNHAIYLQRRSGKSIPWLARYWSRDTSTIQSAIRRHCQLTGALRP